MGQDFTKTLITPEYVHRRVVDNLVQKRIEKRLSLTEMSERLQVSLSYMSQLESCRRTPSFDLLVRWILAVGGHINIY